jgi:hypothetical protein
VGFGVRQYAQRESISKRAPSTTRTSLRLESTTYEPSPDRDRADCDKSSNLSRPPTGFSSYRRGQMAEADASEIGVRGQWTRLLEPSDAVSRTSRRLNLARLEPRVHAALDAAEQEIVTLLTLEQVRNSGS